MTIPVVLCWSGGKDSALALDQLRREKTFEVVALLTTLSREFERIAMHGVRRQLLELQAESIGIPLRQVWISQGAGNAEYEAAMACELKRLHDQGVATVAFGDLFLQDIRQYRERQMGELNMQPIFPIWGRNTQSLAQEFVNAGFRGLTTCIDTTALPESFCGRELTHEFFRELPTATDPCGENGEYHTFVFDGPSFSRPLEIRRGELHRDGQFLFRDITVDHPTSAETK